MGCTCSSEANEKSKNERRNEHIQENMRAQAHQQNMNLPQRSQIPINRNHQISEAIERHPENQLRLSQNLPSYEPYLQSKNNLNFNMKETENFVGEGLKRMRGYICNIEEDELIKKRNDFWSSQFEGNEEVWCLLQSFCNGEFSNSDLTELMQGSCLTTYAGCINVVYDSKGNLYEIPNYCIHLPLKYDIPKLAVLEPQDQIINLRLRNGATDYLLEFSNKDSILSLKRHLQKEINSQQPGTVKGTDKIRLFFRGKELKDKDKIFMHSLENNSIIMVMISKDV